MATFLTLTNELLREMNEVAMTSANFTNAIGVQQHAKDLINRSYLDIVTEETKWPFLATAESGTTNPIYGNVSQDSVEGKRWYELKPASSSITTDYGSVDWDTFYLTTVGVSGETSPYETRNLRFTTTEEWKDYYRLSENNDNADAQQYGVPRRIIRSPDGRNFGLSPIPDKVYRIWYFAYDSPVDLIAFGDVTIFPELYRTVLMARARYYMHQFKENPQAASFALADYKRSLKLMKIRLMSPAPTELKDDRVRFV